jgi:hypothetical protein
MRVKGKFRPTRHGHEQALHLPQLAGRCLRVRPPAGARRPRAGRVDRFARATWRAPSSRGWPRCSPSCSAAAFFYRLGTGQIELSLQQQDFVSASRRRRPSAEITTVQSLVHRRWLRSQPIEYQMQAQAILPFTETISALDARLSTKPRAVFVATKHFGNQLVSSAGGQSYGPRVMEPLGLERTMQVRPV